jgi:hypothetical protein
MHHSQVGNESEDADHEPDENGEIQSHHEQCDGNQESINEADDEVVPEKLMR